jgi:hypothetical protein
MLFLFKEKIIIINIGVISSGVCFDDFFKLSGKFLVK